MQNSALYRRGIVCPLDQIAEEQLRLNTADSATHVRFVAIPNDNLFAALWQLKLFEEINARCGTMVDDYEEEWIEAPRVAEIVAAIDSVMDSVRDPEVAAFMAAFRSLSHQAEMSSRPLLFVF